jgi:hypothetical protein
MRPKRSPGCKDNPVVCRYIEAKHRFALSSHTVLANNAPVIVADESGLQFTKRRPSDRAGVRNRAHLCELFSTNRALQSKAPRNRAHNRQQLASGCTEGIGMTN